MDLVRLTEDNVDNICGKPIFCVEYSPAYFKDLAERFPQITDSVAGCFDNAARNQGVKDFWGRSIKVKGLSELADVSGEAVLLITSDYFWEVYDSLNTNREINNLFTAVYYFPNRETEIDLSYRERYANEPLRDILLFRSGPHASGYVPGTDFNDNARALFEYLLRNGYNERYQLVWLVHDPAEYVKKYQGVKNVSFISYDGALTDDLAVREEYYRALCLARYIFFTDAYGFARNARKDQIRVQLWHGCGIKRRVNFVPCEKRYEYTTVISRLYADLHARDYGLRADQMLVTGYPKEDWLFHPRNDWREVLDIPAADKYIFWLPTFRTAGVSGLKNLDEQAEMTETGLPVVDSFRDLDLLEECLAELKVVLIVKLHPFQDRSKIGFRQRPHIVLLENSRLCQSDIQINELLGHAAALISDYSSAAIDYTILNRPIAFTLDDYEVYGENRGFNWPDVRNWLPGREIFDFAEFLQFVKEVAAGVDVEKDKRERLARLFHDFFDDKSSERIVKVLGI